jgi:hypothetical protein
LKFQGGNSWLSKSRDDAPEAEILCEKARLQQNTVNDGLPARRSRSSADGEPAGPGGRRNSTYGASGTGTRVSPVAAFHLA